MQRKPEDVEVVPSDEGLCRVGGERVFSASAYAQRGYGTALPDVWLRKDAARRVAKASRLLPRGLGLLVWDGWRSLDLQEELYTQYRDEIKVGQGLEGADLEEATRRFVSPPQPGAPHTTGGTVDLTLCDERGGPLEMGGEFDQLDDCSRTDYYQDEGTFHKRRRLLLAVMTHVGFSNYPEEWWHFDLGNTWHHARVGGPARYGFVESLA